MASSGAAIELWHGLCQKSGVNQTLTIFMKKTTMPVRSLVTALFLAGSLTFFQGCRSDGKKESRTEDAMEKTGDAIASDTKDATAEARDNARAAGDKIDVATDDAAANFRRERDKVVADLKDERGKLDAKIDRMKADMKQEGRDAKVKSQQQLDKLEVERRQLGNDIDKAQNATAAAWQDVKAGFKKAGRSIGDAFDRAGEKLDGDGKN